MITNSRTKAIIYDRYYNHKTNFKFISFLILAFLFVGVSYAIATTYITDSGTSTFGSNIEMDANQNITAGRINEVYYVQAGNASDIQAKINLCPSTGCNVHIPNSNQVYNITSSVITKDNVNIICDGNPVLQLDPGNSLSRVDENGWNVGAVIFINGTKNNIVSGCNINGTGDDQTIPVDPEDGYAGVYCYQCSNVKIRDNNIHEMGTNNTAIRGWGILFVRSNASTAEYNEVWDNGYEGIGIRKLSKDIQVSNNLGYQNFVHCIQASGFGDTQLDSETPTNWIISENTCGKEFSSTNSDKIISDQADYGKIIKNIVPRIHIIENVSNLEISDNIIRTYTFSPAYWGIAGISLVVQSGNGRTISNIQIRDNKIYSTNGFGGVGISLENYGTQNIKDIIIEGNQIEMTYPIYLLANTSDNINNIQIENNILDGNGSGYGVYILENTVGYLRVSENIFKDLNRAIFSELLDEVTISKNILSSVTSPFENVIINSEINQVSNQDLLLSMSFNNNSISGTTVYDLTSNKNEGIASGVTHITTGIMGGAYSFDGINDFINVTSPSFDGTGNLTVSLWFKVLGAGGGGYGRLLDKGKLEIYLREDQKRIYILSNGTVDATSDVISKVNAYVANQWTHLAITRASDGSDVHIYIDGQDVSSETSGAGGLASSEPLYIGNRGSDIARALNGTIDNVQIWGRLLGEDEIKSLFETKQEDFGLNYGSSGGYTGACADGTALTVVRGVITACS